MDLYELKNHLKEVQTYFKQKTAISDDTLKLWHKECGHVPFVALDFIANLAKENLSTLPTNYPRVMKKYWGAYLNAHPEKRIHAKEQAGFDCPDCHGVGVLHFKKVDSNTGFKYAYVAICASCNASHERLGSLVHEGGKVPHKSESGHWIPDGEYVPPMARMTRQEIINRGYEFMEPENKYAEVAYNPDYEEKYVPPMDMLKNVNF